MMFGGPGGVGLVYDGIPEVDGDNDNAELTFQE